MYRLPLSGIRILDLTMGWAGPYAGRLLGDMGAEVIKIESVRNWDGTRSPRLPGHDEEKGYNRSTNFNHLNRNKLGCALDLSHPRGRELFLKLVALSDAVIECHNDDVADDPGLSYDALRLARPDVILVTVSADGKDGPVPGISVAAALCAALLYRRRTGHGRRVEVAQRESMASLIGELFVGFSMNGRQPPPLGNRHRSMAPHGCYPCAGPSEAGWLAVAVASDAEFAALCRVVGRSELAADPRFADVVSRYRHQDELDEAISAWTRGKTPGEAAMVLQEAGVAASPVGSVANLMDDPHLRERGFFEKTAHPEADVCDMEGVPWRLSLTPAHVRLSAPCFGEHDDYVFRHLLGLSADEVTELESQGVFGGTPLLSLHD
jgi:crotonobetainyl-CoA:carnitine CoA-transferase CaiB-like acyl-CoA transferase